MNRRELVKAIAAHTGVEAKQVDAVVKGFTEVTTAVVAKGEPVAITGFAKFAKRELPARMGRNPATGAAIRIKASKKARITPLKAFKDAVTTPSAAPKLARGVWPPAAVPAKAPTAKGPARKAPASKAAVSKTAATRKAPAAKAGATKATTRKAPAAKAGARKATSTKAPAKRATKR